MDRDQPRFTITAKTKLAKGGRSINAEANVRNREHLPVVVDHGQAVRRSPSG
jgi:hypothetical protein